MKFQVIKGRHVHKGKKYFEGDIIESDSPLDTLFRGKFMRVSDTFVDNIKPIEKSEAQKETKPKDDDDCTADFFNPEEIEKNGVIVRVVKKGNRKSYDVFDAEHPEDGKLNDAPLAKGAVIDFVLNLEEVDDDGFED